MPKEEKQKRQRKWFIRSIINLGDYCDHTVIKEKSMTDPSQDEPIQRLVARMMRGEQVATAQVKYDDIKPGATPEEIFRSMSQTFSKDFDISDAPAIIERAQRALDELKKAAGTKPSPEPQKPQGGSVPVEKKEDEKPKVN